SYNYVATDPPMLAINISTRDGDFKDTARNIRESREFVVNVATEAMLEQMHASAAEYPPEVSEVEELGLQLLPSAHVCASRRAGGPVQMDGRQVQIIPLGRGTNSVYIGEVGAFHLSSEIDGGRRVDRAGMRPVVRRGCPFYAGVCEIF